MVVLEVVSVLSLISHCFLSALQSCPPRLEFSNEPFRRERCSPENVPIPNRVKVNAPRLAEAGLAEGFVECDGGAV
jgi:hypothetical protein